MQITKISYSEGKTLATGKGFESKKFLITSEASLTEYDDPTTAIELLKKVVKHKLDELK